MTTPNYVWFDGEFASLEDARAYFNDNPRYQAPSVVAGLRCYETERGAAVFRLVAHVAHFTDRVMQMGFALDAYRDLSLSSAILRTIMVNNLGACHVRLQLFIEMPAEDGVADDIRPKILITATPLDTDPLTLSVDGYEADFTRPVTCVLSDNIIHVGPVTSSCDVVARDTVLTLAEELGYGVVETRFSAELLATCDEAFSVSTQDEIVPVSVVDGVAIGEPGQRPMTDTLRRRYTATARGATRRSLGWIDYVTMEPLF